MKSHREDVLAVHPAAKAQFNPPVVGDERGGYWAIYRTENIGATALGQGPDEEAAWADADAKVMADGSTRDQA